MDKPVEQFIKVINEISPLFSFATKEKLQAEHFFEIPITDKTAIYIDKDSDHCQEIIDAVKFRRSIIYSSDRDSLMSFPNLYFFKDRSRLEALKLLSNKFEESDNQGQVPESIFVAQAPRHTLDRVILNPQVKEDILTSLILIQNQDKIYKDWGFEEIDKKPKLILNFYGAPGTGKTMVSHAIAEKLGKKILNINYAEIESKYVGDAPKNLLKAFQTATAEDAVLFFDEADSFLGKRIENVQSSSDQSINSLRSQMLILLEDFGGVVLFATNLVKNYDKAFESRILKHIQFELPNTENREQVIRLTIPSKVPFNKNVDIDALCRKLAEISEGFSGREIKNAVLESLTIAVQKNTSLIDEQPFILGFEKTLAKLKKLNEERQSNNAISKEFKEKLENKIKENLDKKEVDGK